MPEVESHFTTLNAKLKQFIKLYDGLLLENNKLKNALTEKEVAFNTLKNEQIHLNEQVSLLKSSNGQLIDTDKAALEKRIDTYLKTINKTIEALNK